MCAAAFAQPKYPRMAAADQYLMADRNAEIALARSAAPASISAQAEVLVLGRKGFETAAKGTNGFVCAVSRGFTAAFDDPVFWNPKIRGPICFNAAAVHTYLPIMIARARWVMAGKSIAQMQEATKAAFDKREFAPQEPGAMCYMLSKQQYLTDAGVAWRPHLMFFVPLKDAKSWGAGLDGSPILQSDDAADRLTVLMIPVARWSDGTADSHP